MDAAIIGLKVVAKLTTAVLDKAAQVEKFQKRETATVYQYKKSIQELANEAERINDRLKVTSQARHRRDAVANLLNNEEGGKALKRLVTMLNETQIFLQVQDQAANSTIENMEKRKGKGFVGLVADMANVSAEESNFDATMEDATLHLDGHRSDLRQQFEHFNSLLETFHSQISTNTSRVAFEGHYYRDHNSNDDNLSSVMSAFYDCPFQFTFTNTATVNGATSTEITKGALSGSNPYVETMKRMGDDWATNNSPISSETTLQSLENVQKLLMEKLLTTVGFELAVYGLKESVGESPEGVTNDLRCAQLALMQTTMQREVERIETRRFSIAFCGMVKAGKSTFLNALTGLNLLPSDDLPATAWPCRLRHVKGQLEPVLILDRNHFQVCIEKLREQKYGEMMENYKPPRESIGNIFDAFLEPNKNGDDTPVHVDQTSDAIREEHKKIGIYCRWIDLGDETKRNLLCIESPNFILPDRASGSKDVIKVLGLVNDIVRLCGRFEIERPSNELGKWPIINLEFDSLSRRVLDNDFEFIDLPGVGESGGEFHDFEILVRRVAREVNAVVPVVSFKEIPKDDWRQHLPSIITDGLQRAPDLVLCTHLDHAKDHNRARELTSSVSRAFWPGSSSKARRKRVLTCATRMGISATSLLRTSEFEKPAFSDIWQQESIFYDCALKILGKLDSEETYNDMDLDEWRQVLNEQSEKSGLPGSIDRLVSGMVVTASLRTLKDENSLMIKQLNQAIGNQHRLLLEMQRTREDYNKAYAQFLGVSKDYNSLLESWESEQEHGRFTSNTKLVEEFKKEAEETTERLSKCVEDRIEEFQTLGKLALTQPNSQMTFQPSDAEQFLQEIQREAITILNKVKAHLVAFVRILASESHATYFRSLQEKITTQLVDEKFQTPLRDDIIMELDEKGSNIEAMLFLNIKQEVMRTIAVRHTGATAYRAIQGALAKPFLRSRGTANDGAADEGANEGSDRHPVRRSINDLGFMLRAPITVVASVSWLLGSGIWPFVTQAQKVVMNKQELINRLHKQLFAKVFSDLQKEGQETLDKMITASWTSAKSVVEDELQSEKQRYLSEGRLKTTGENVSEDRIVSSLALLLNFIAAKAAMTALKGKLEDWATKNNNERL